MPIINKLELYGHGPWINEPDLVEFVHLGIMCQVERCPATGALSGRCIVPKHHSWNQKVYFHEIEIETHGQPRFVRKDDCVHILFICDLEDDLVPVDERDSDDVKAYRAISYCVDMCKYVAEQIIEGHERS